MTDEPSETDQEEAQEEDVQYGGREDQADALEQTEAREDAVEVEDGDDEDEE